MPEMSEEQRKALEEKIKKMSPEELKEFQKQQCVFCQIVAGKIPSKKIYEDDKCIAVLDINPAMKGHLLLIPKEHYAIMPQIPDKEMGHYFIVSKALSQMLLKVLKVSGTNIFIANGYVAGQKAQHFLIHIIPRKEGDKIMDIPEKIINADMQENVLKAVEGKFNTLMGIKKNVSIRKQLDKEVVPAEKNKLEVVVSDKPKNQLKEKVTNFMKEVKNNSKSKQMVKEAAKELVKKKVYDVVVGKGKKNLKKIEKEAVNEEKTNLDDIAYLFR